MCPAQTEPEIGPPTPLEELKAEAWFDLAVYAEAVYPGYAAADCHQLLARKLEDCLARKIRRLTISFPPQHGKSKLASVIFPTWALTKFPKLRFMQAGYNRDLSEEFCREARTIIQSDRYQQLYPDIQDKTVNRQSYWKTTSGGSYFATGIGGTATGKGMDVVIIDDPFKDREDADNATQRDRVWSWFVAVVLPRLAPDAIVIVIQTRWHEDDLIGRLNDPDRVAALKELGFDDMVFENLHIEAICEDPENDPLHRPLGAPCWPEGRPLGFLERQKATIGPREFASLYQGRPAIKGGNLVDASKINIIDPEDVPEGLNLTRAWDLALESKKGGKTDYHAGAYGDVHRYQIVGPDKKPMWVEDFYLVHMSHGKRNWAAQKALMLAMINIESIGRTVALETVAGFKIAAAELRDATQGKCIIKSIDVHKNKEHRAMAWFALIEAGRFYMVRGPWNAAFINELEQFPNGANDDQVDSVSVLYESQHKKDRLLLA